MYKPNARNFLTDSAMHTAMGIYARTKDKPILEATITFDDGSVWVTELKRLAVPIEYRLTDGELYEVYAYCGLFEDSIFDKPLNKTQAKRALLDWVDQPISKVEWRDIK